MSTTGARSNTGPSLVLLGAPALALALSITTISALVPLTLRRLTGSSVLIGAVVAGEGLFALILPLWIGALSDRTKSPLGPRLPYVILGTVCSAAALLALPFAASIASIAGCVMAFYLGYFFYYPTYRALYADVVPSEHFARSQGVQTLFREIGLALALTGSPVAFSLSRRAPFFLCAGALVVISALMIACVHRQARGVQHTILQQAKRERIWPSPSAQRILAANALWEFALGALKTFVVLYVVVGTGRSPSAASLLMGIVAVVAVVAAPIAGRLGDRFGPLRVMRVALWVYALGLFLPGMTSSLAILVPAMPLVGFGGAVAMTLPFALLAEYSGARRHGANAGLYEFSRGAGASLGPVLTGAAIDSLGRFFPATHGYAVMWWVQAGALLVSIALLPHIETRGDAAADAAPLRSEQGATRS